MKSGLRQENIFGLPGGDPAGFYRVKQAGVHTIGYRTKRSKITLKAAAFEAYLKEEGLAGILYLRADRNQSHLPVDELFSRCAKAMFDSAIEEDVAFSSTPIGLTLEIVPKTNPSKLLPGEQLPLQVLFHGEPLPGIRVVALNQHHAGKPIRSTTDGEGKVMFELPEDGFWLIKAVHMVEAPSETGADWESIWASLTFKVSTYPSSSVLPLDVPVQDLGLGGDEIHRGKSDLSLPKVILPVPDS